MKNLFIILLILTPIFALGQTMVGARGAWGLSGVYIAPTQYQKPIYGNFEAGLMLKHYNLKYIGFQGELNIVERGYRKPVNEWAFYKRENTYIELPIFLQGKVQYRASYLILNAGCYAAYLIDSQEGDNLSGAYVMNDYDFSIVRDNRFDYGLLGGLGLGYDIKNITLQVEARVLYGFGDIYDHSFDGNPTQSPFFSQSISFGVLYNFSYKKGIAKLKTTPIKTKD